MTARDRLELAIVLTIKNPSEKRRRARETGPLPNLWMDYLRDLVEDDMCARGEDELLFGYDQ